MNIEINLGGCVCNKWPNDCERAEVDIRKSWAKEVGPNFWSALIEQIS